MKYTDVRKCTENMKNYFDTSLCILNNNFHFLNSQTTVYVTSGITHQDSFNSHVHIPLSFLYHAESELFIEELDLPPHNQTCMQLLLHTYKSITNLISYFFLKTTFRRHWRLLSDRMRGHH